MCSKTAAFTFKSSTESACQDNGLHLELSGDRLKYFPAAPVYNLKLHSLVQQRLQDSLSKIKPLVQCLLQALKVRVEIHDRFCNS